jgi:integrase
MARLGAARLRGNSWEARWRKPDGREQSKRGFPNKQAALDYAAAKQTESRRARNGAEYIDPNRTIPTFATVAEDWYQDRKRRNRTPKTLMGYRSILDRHLLPTFGRTKVNRINLTDIERFDQALMQKQRAPGTRKNAARVLSAILKRAQREGHIQTSPTSLVEHDWQQMNRPKRPTALTLQQVDLLANQITEHYRSLILFAAFSAMRQGELGALRWADIDTTKQTIHVHASASHSTIDGKYQRHIGPTKNKRSATIPLLLPIEELPQRPVAHSEVDGLVFTTPNGQPIQWDNWRKRVWAPAIQACCDIDPTFPITLRFHDLRHTFVSIAYNDLGLNPKQIQEVTRHATLSVLLDIYTHVFAGWETDIAAKLNEARRRARLRVVGDDS